MVQMVIQEKRDFHLQTVTPSHNKSLTSHPKKAKRAQQDWMTDIVDIDGNPRIFRGTVDMGCYQHGYVSGTIFKIHGKTE